jgi:hypothetical protein
MKPILRTLGFGEKGQSFGRMLEHRQDGGEVKQGVYTS